MPTIAKAIIATLAAIFIAGLFIDPVGTIVIFGIALFLAALIVG